MADNFSSLYSPFEEEIFDARTARNVEDNRVNAQKPEVIDFLPASSIPVDEEQEANYSNSLPKIEEEKSDQELTPEPELLLESAEKGIVDHVERILDKDLSLINCRDSDGYSPLHRACYNGHFNVVKVLLQRGADVEARTEDGWQPLHCACRWGEYELTALHASYCIFLVFDLSNNCYFK